MLKLSILVCLICVWVNIRSCISIGYFKESRVFCDVCLRSFTQKKWEFLVSCHIKKSYLGSQKSTVRLVMTLHVSKTSVNSSRARTGMILAEFRKLESPVILFMPCYSISPNLATDFILHFWYTLTHLGKSGFYSSLHNPPCGLISHFSHFKVALFKLTHSFPHKPLAILYVPH